MFLVFETDKDYGMNKKIANVRKVRNHLIENLMYFGVWSLGS
jgi:hypothetical protein